MCAVRTRVSMFGSVLHTEPLNTRNHQIGSVWHLLRPASVRCYIPMGRDCRGTAVVSSARGFAHALP